MKRASEDLSKLASDFSSNIGAFQNKTDAQLAEALRLADTSYKDLLGQGESRLAAAEAQLKENAEVIVVTNQKRTEELVEELAGLKEQVSLQIQQATGFALFGAFQLLRGALTQVFNNRLFQG